MSLTDNNINDIIKVITSLEIRGNLWQSGFTNVFVVHSLQINN